MIIEGNGKNVRTQKMYALLSNYFNEESDNELKCLNNKQKQILNQSIELLGKIAGFIKE